MVTSARPREGKSFIALNIAASIAAELTQPVLLVDADTKPAGTTLLLGLGDHPGLLDLAASPGQPVGDIVVPTAVPGLFFLPVGGSGDGRGRPALAANTSAAGMRRTSIPRSSSQSVRTESRSGRSPASCAKPSTSIASFRAAQ